MPELPEVETTLRGIDPFIRKQRIKNIVVRQGRLRHPVNQNINEQLEGKTIRSLQRRAKYLIFELCTGYILIHLGMSGHLRLVPSGLTAGKHDHIDLLLTNALTLRYCDPRRFGLWLYLEDASQLCLFLNNLGPEPLSEAFNVSYMSQRVKNKKLAIKTFIMRNDVVVGVGNIYATESLFIAGIHPKTPAGLLNDADTVRLVRAIKNILRQAIKAGGTSLKDFYGSDGKPGYFTQSLQMYGRSGLPCFKCHTTIPAMKIAGRTSSYCPSCQPEKID